MSAAKQKPLNEAVAGIKPIVDKLVSEKIGARCMEQVTDKCGVVFERWLLRNGTSVVIFGTPHWRDAFIQAAPGSNTWADTLAAIDRAAGAA